MGRKNGNGARATLRHDGRQFEAGLGVRYKIKNARQLSAFRNALEDRFALHIPELVTHRRNREKFDPGFSLKNPDQYAITVVEASTIAALARRNRHTWGAHDAGRVKGKIADLRSRLHQEYAPRMKDAGYPMGVLALRLSNVAVAGKCSDKLVLKPIEDHPTTKYLHDLRLGTLSILAAEMQYGAGRGELSEDATHECRGREIVARPYDPHMTIGHVYARASDEQFASCRKEAEELIGSGLQVRLDQLELIDYGPVL